MQQRVKFRATRSYYTPGVGVSTDSGCQYGTTKYPFQEGCVYVEKGKLYEITVADGVASIRQVESED